MAGSISASGRIAARSLTAIVGGYAATAGVVSLIARLAPIDRAEATIWAMTLSFLVYACFILWAFQERRLTRAVLTIWGLAALSGTTLWLIGPAA